MLDEQYLKTPFFGARRMVAEIRSRGFVVSRKRVRRLMRLMGLEAIYQKPRTSIPAPGHKKYSYLLGGLTIDRPGQVSASDITYIPMARGFLYLVAVMDWHSRFILGWRLSNTIESTFCAEALKDSFTYGLPEISNTDQGSQFTSEDRATAQSLWYHQSPLTKQLNCRLCCQSLRAVLSLKELALQFQFPE